jgi:hypothetical protein
MTIAVLALIPCLWIANEVYANHNRRVIERTVAAVQEFRLNATTLTEARDRLQAVTSRDIGQSLDPDGNTEINASLVVPQGGLKRLGRVFWFSITLKFDNTNRLTSKRVLLTSNSYACCSAEVWELSSLAGREAGRFQVLHYDPYRIIVHLGSDADMAESKTAWDWQLSCLTSVDGCNDVRRILPTLRPPHRAE